MASAILMRGKTLAGIESFDEETISFVRLNCIMRICFGINNGQG